MVTAIVNAQVFDGQDVIGERNVILDGTQVLAVDVPVPSGATLVDGAGATLLPGLIDSHVHTDLNGLRDALAFGVTTELEMQGHWSPKTRQEIVTRDDVADLRTSGMGVRTKGGHPSEYITSGSLLMRLVYPLLPSVNTPEQARRFVAKQVASGADYIKVFIEDGSTIGYPGLPVINQPTLLAAIRAAHEQDRLVIAHATTADGARRAIASGVDGLAHLFLDAPTPGLIDAIAASGAFVVPTLVTMSTAFGHDAAELAADPRVCARLNQAWLGSLKRSMNAYPQGDLETAFTSVRALRDAAVDILAGSDVSEPLPMLGGLAHGASLHHELQLLVQAGFTPVEALRAAASVPARRFGLTDRGRIAPGMRADLLLVDGDPTTTIGDTLSTRAIWRRGVQQTVA
ncbi:MAG: amidohydrolase family protein [Propionibacteriaceae bacterium]|nr:amidohydrolase family protein [Propionibacteriaceae bacterium]